MKSIKKILHPTDFSQPAMAAFEVACTLAGALGAKLLLLHVRPMPIKVLPGEGIPVPEVGDESETAFRARLDALVPADSKIAVERYLLIGDEGVEIIDTATETGCDLIVMGTHGRSGVTRLLMGSVAEEVSRRAPCAVVTVKAKAAE
jgi:nucleotide-binding universal stress UspA family protein